MRALKHWAIAAALPFWERVGYDASRGGFHERLHLSGEPDRSADRRSRVQARQIYVYAHAAALGWYPDGKAAALRGLDFLLARYRAPDGRPGFVHALAADGSIANATRDAYDHAFILLALAWLSRASSDAQIAALAAETLAFVDEHLTAPDGSLFEGVPPSLPRRQNPHMHMFEALLALHEAMGEPSALPRAERLRDMLQARFLDRASGMLCEYFDDQWRRWPDDLGMITEPGHHAEWSWLLRRHERLAGHANAPLASDLLRRALAGMDPETGFLVDAVSPTGAIRAPGRRCWPQTELAKAQLAEFEIGVVEAAAAARQSLRRMADSFLASPIPGAWIDAFDAHGRPCADCIPASTFYHLFCAIAEADRVLGRPALPA